MANIEKTEAICLRNTRLRETSLLISFFTRDFGKVKVISKGVRKKNSRLLSHYEPFVYQEIIFYHNPKRELDLVTDSTMKKSFSYLKEDFFSLCAASYLVDLVDEVTQPLQKSEKLFNLLLDCLLALHKGVCFKIIRFFEIHLLHIAGLFPNITQCSCCGNTLNDEYVFFSFKQGGIVCSRLSCTLKTKDAIKITKGCVSSMAFLKTCQLVDLQRFKISNIIAAELANVMKRFMIFHIGRELRTMKFMEKIKKDL